MWTALLALSAALTGTTVAGSGPLRLSGAVGGFTGRLFEELSSAEGGNFAYSPYSLHVALSMALIGAPEGTDTYGQLAGALGTDPATDCLSEYLALSLRYRLLDLDPRQRLSLANRAFADRSLAVRPDYLEALRVYFDSGLERVDFGEAGEAARSINAFVNATTAGLVDDIAQPSHFTLLTRLVLINAIYFRADWHTMFDASQTAPMEFRVRPGLTVTHTAGMSMPSARLRVAHLPEATVVELPYAGGQLRMLLLLPTTTTTSGEASAITRLNLTAIDLGGDLGGRLRPARVSLRVPRFDLAYEVRLRDTLENMGVRDIFDAKAADLTDMADGAGSTNLYVSDVVHKAEVSVDERGSEAAAATSVQVDTRAGTAGALTHIAFDRPFAFAIHDPVYNVPLFVGRVVDPTPAGDNRLQQPQLADPCGQLGYDTSDPEAVALPCPGRDTIALQDEPGLN